MNRSEKLAEIRTLQTEVDALREELGISAPGEITYLADLDVASNDIVLVIADGFGGATTRIVEGNYPVDYTTKFERLFQTEGDAEDTAEEIVRKKLIPREGMAATA